MQHIGAGLSVFSQIGFLLSGYCNFLSLKLLLIIMGAEVGEDGCIMSQSSKPFKIQWGIAFGITVSVAEIIMISLEADGPYGISAVLNPTVQESLTDKRWRNSPISHTIIGKI